MAKSLGSQHKPKMKSKQLCNLTTIAVKHLPLSKNERVTTDSLKLYFREISKIPLLTAKEEVVLAKRIEKRGRRSQTHLDCFQFKVGH